MIRKWSATTFQALENPQYRLLWIGSLFSMLAFMMQWTVQSVVAFDLAGTHRAVGLAQLGVGLSMLILGPFGGVFADRVSKKPMVLWGQSIIAVTFFVTGWMILAGSLTLFWLVALTSVMGIVFAFLSPALQAWVGEVVPQRMLPNAVALSQLAANGSRVVGPLIAGTMLGTAAIGAGGAYLFMGALFLGVLLTLSRLPATHAKPDVDRRPVWAELMQGVRYVGGNAAIRTLMLLFMAVVVLGYMWQIVLPSLLERHLGRSSSDVGFILTVNAIAGLAVALPLAGIVSTRWAWPAMFACVALLGIGFILLAAAPSFEMVLLATIALGPGLAGFMLVNNALTMSNTAPGYFGRVMSLMMLAWGVQGLLSLPFGILADAIGERQMLTGMGIVLLVIAVMGALAALRLARRGEFDRPVQAAVAETTPSESVNNEL
jgi:MFS family permease